MGRFAAYFDVLVCLAVFVASLAAYLEHADDLTKGLATASFGALLALLRPSGAPAPPPGPAAVQQPAQPAGGGV